MLAVENLRAIGGRGVERLRGVSLQVRAGEILGIAGVAGNGRSELLEILGGIRQGELVGQPTRGMEIGAIEFIHEQIVALRDAGKAVLLMSVELDEILSRSDRLAVMLDGRIMGERLPSETDERELGLMVAGITDTGREYSVHEAGTDPARTAGKAG